MSLRLIGPLALIFTMGCAAHPKTARPGYKGLGAGSLTPAQVSKFAPPALNPADQERVQKMLDIRGASRGVISPDGKTLFFTWPVTGTAQVWKMTGALGFPEQFTAGQDSTGVVTILPNGKDLVISRDRNGEENPGIYLQSVQGGELRPIYHQKGIQARFSYVTDDSRFLYFTANSERSDSYAIHRHDLKTGKTEVLFKEPGTWMIADVKGDQFLLRKATGSLWSEFSLWNPTDGKLAPLLGQGEKEDYDMSFGALPGEFLVSTPKFGDFYRLYSWKNQKFTPISPDVKRELSGYAIDRARQRIYLTWNDGGYFRTEALNARTKAALPAPPLKGMDHLNLTHVSRDGRFAIYGAEDGTAPSSLYVRDWKSGSFKRWISPSTPEVDTRKFARMTLEHYTARDGTKIPMFVSRPKTCDPAPCPVIVNFHGGPESQAIPGFSPYAQIFIDAGFVFISPNVRGSSGYGKSWLAADDGAKRLQVITDIEDAATHVKKAFAAEGKTPKVGVMGGSYGGYSTMYAMTRFAGAYDAGVPIVGMSDLISFLNNTASYRRHLRISEYGDPEKDKDALKELSPITHIDRTKGPMLIIHGLNDPRVPAGEALQMHERLVSKGLPSEFILYADEGHGSAKRDNRANQIGHSLRFFEKHLKEKSLGSGEARK